MPLDKAQEGNAQPQNDHRLAEADAQHQEPVGRDFQDKAQVQADQKGIEHDGGSVGYNRMPAVAVGKIGREQTHQAAPENVPGTVAAQDVGQERAYVDASDGFRVDHGQEGQGLGHPKLNGPEAGKLKGKDQGDVGGGDDRGPG